MEVGADGRIWHHESKPKGAALDGFRLDLDSAAVIKRLCLVFMHPGMYGGLFSLWNLVTYARGMLDVLHADGAGDAARILFCEAESGLLAACGEKLFGKVLARRLDDEMDGCGSMGL